MGVRKRNKAEEVKETKKKTYFAKLLNCPTSPRKMRLVADLIRGVDIERSLSILTHSSKDASGALYKLLKSAIANWEEKNGRKIKDDDNVFVKEVFVDSGRALKRILPAPQGRAHRIKKRSNHVTLIVDSRNIEEMEKSVEQKETKEITGKKKINN
jgi:large subunit ribosomal protein L22